MIPKDPKVGQVGLQRARIRNEPHYRNKEGHNIHPQFRLRMRLEMSAVSIYIYAPVQVLSDVCDNTKPFCTAITGASRPRH